MSLVDKRPIVLNQTKQRLPPGPIGTSCLTCKRRRKKCDHGRPTCQRCVDGGYDCLGYGHNQRRVIPAPSSDLSHAWPVEGREPFVQSQPFGLPGPKSQHCNFVGEVFNQSAGSNTLSFNCSIYETIASGGDFTTETYDHDNGNGNGNGSSSLITMSNHDHQLPAPANKSCNAHHPFPFLVNKSCGQLNASFNDQVVLGPPLGPRAERCLSTLPQHVKNVVNFVLTQYGRVLELYCFRSKDEHVDQIREVVINRLQASSISRHAVHLGARIIQSVLDGTSSSNRAVLNKALDQFEQTLCVIPAQQATTSAEIEYRLNGFLEAAFIRIRLDNSHNAYNLLHHITPAFLQIVYSDSNLWPNFSGLPVPSLARVIASTRYELGHFALVDLTCAMAYGLPQVVEYDTSSPVLATDRHLVEWVHCCPPEFQICLAEINRRYANRYLSHDWHLIERRLLAFKPALSMTDGVESWRVVGRLAVIESWRQVLLVYLYMAVCGLASDDTRVQSAVRQTVQLLGTLKYQDPPKVNVHCVFQYLTVGICTRSEKRRAYVRERLLDAFDNELWLLSGSKFVPVLDHLWHGAAANGKPVKWNDYIISRQIALPISI